MVAREAEAKGRVMRGTFTGLDNAMLDELLTSSNRAFKVAVAMARRHNGLNNGNIPFSVREASLVARCNQRDARKALVSTAE